MSETIIKGLFNPDSLNEVSKGTIHYIDIDLIEDNELNSLYSQNDIEGLKDNIKEFHLKEPLIVHKNNNGTYRLMSGHRRLKACKLLCEEGTSIIYSDRELKDKLPCIYDETEYADEDDELLAIISSNTQRILSKQERIKIFETLKEIYVRKCEKGQKPKGREREVISKWLGVSERTIQNYKSESPVEQVQIQNNKGKIIKRFSSLEKYFTDFDDDRYNDDEINEIKAAAIPAINIILNTLNISISEL